MGLKLSVLFYPKFLSSFLFLYLGLFVSISSGSVLPFISLFCCYLLFGNFLLRQTNRTRVDLAILLLLSLRGLL